jgi:hypothetical protein
LRKFREEYRAQRAMMEYLLTKLGMPPAEQEQFIRKHGVGTGADADPRATHVAALASKDARPEARADLQDAVRGFGSETTDETADETIEETTGELSCASGEEAELEVFE